MSNPTTLVLAIDHLPAVRAYWRLLEANRQEIIAQEEFTHAEEDAYGNWGQGEMYTPSKYERVVAQRFHITTDELWNAVQRHIYVTEGCCMDNTRARTHAQQEG